MTPSHPFLYQSTQTVHVDRQRSKKKKKKIRRSLVNTVTFILLFSVHWPFGTLGVFCSLLHIFSLSLYFHQNSYIFCPVFRYFLPLSPQDVSMTYDWIKDTCQWKMDLKMLQSLNSRISWKDVLPITLAMEFYVNVHLCVSISG